MPGTSEGGPDLKSQGPRPTAWRRRSRATRPFRSMSTQEDIARPSLDKTEQAVLDLARAGMSLARIEAIIPEPAERVRAAMAALVEMGVLIPG